MTDNEIVKALDIKGDDVVAFLTDENHEPCIVYNIDVLHLINRQKSEIEELEAEIDKQYEQARADILGNMSDGGTSCHWCIDEHRKRAIKEFAERVKDEYSNGFFVETGFFKQIDNLVKEMVGDDDGNL